MQHPLRGQGGIVQASVGSRAVRPGVEIVDKSRCVIGENWTAKPKNLSHQHDPAEKKA